MGNKAQGPFREAYNPNLQGWQVSRSTGDFNVWSNITSGEEMEQYRFVINDVKEFQHQKEIFEFRYDSSTLVSSRFFREDTQRELCSTYYKGMLFLERIPIRLSNINDLPYPDVLHLYHQAFRGFAQLHDKMGYFIIEENMICLNQQGRVKVWANGQLEKSYPADAIMGAQGTQREMVRRIIQLIDQNTDNLTMPENIGALLQQADPPTFRDADLMIQNFAARHRIIIPNQIDSVLRREDIVRAADSVYLHSPLNVRNAPTNNVVMDLSQQSAPAMTKMSLIQNPGLANTAAFGYQTVGSNVATTSIVPQVMTHTFAPQPLMQTFAYPNGPVSSTSMADILAPSMTTIQPPLTTIATNRQYRNTGLRSTNFMVRPTTGAGIMMPFVSGLANKHSNAVNVITQHGASKQALHIEKLVSAKPTTGAVDKPYELNSQHLLMKESFIQRHNSRSVAPRHFDTHNTNLQGSRYAVVHTSTLNNTNIRNYSSMMNTSLKNNLVGVVTKKTQQTSSGQHFHQSNIEVKLQPEKKIASIKNQIITPVQPIINRTVETQQHQTLQNQRQTVSPPTSYLMQHIGRMNPARHQSLSEPVQVVSQFRSSGSSASFKPKQLATIDEHARNKESSPTAAHAYIRKQIIAQSSDEKKRAFSTYNSTIASEVPIKGSHIFHPSQLHPSIQISYESSRIATNPSDLYMPTKEAQMSFGKGQPNIYMQMQRPDPSNVNILTSQQSGEGTLSSKQILDTITYVKTKKDDHLTSHLPVTYSVLKQSEEFLSKYGSGFDRVNEYTGYGETATSGIRASLGSHYNEEDTNLGRNLYYNKQQYRQQSRQLEEPFRPIYSSNQPTQGYYTGVQVNYHQQKVQIIENITQSLNTAQVKYSVYEETIQTKRNDLRSLKDNAGVLPPQSHQITTSFTNSQPLRSAVDDYTLKMDSDLRKDLEQMRKSYL